MPKKLKKPKKTGGPNSGAEVPERETAGSR